MESLTRQLKIVRAHAFDAPKLTRIALEAKRHWGYPEEWIEIWRDDLYIPPSQITSSETYCGLIDTELAGFYQLRDDRRTAELEHLWILPKFQKQGIGRALFAHAVERARDLCYTRFAITSDPKAAEFYRKMGARKVSTFSTTVGDVPRKLPVFVYNLG
jgi:GNAT superfamily N-acetyltransferase